MKWDEYKAQRDAGKTPSEIVESGLVSRSTAWRLEKRFSGDDATVVLDPAPEGIRVHAYDAKPNAGKARRKSGTKKAPITEETAGLILKGLSEIGAFLAQEQELALTSEEVSLLEGPLSESLALIPAEASAAINKYAAPGMFVTQFVAIYARKMQRIGMKRAGLAPRQPVRGSGTSSSTGPVVPPGQRSAPTPAELELLHKAAAAAAQSGNGQPPPASTESAGTLETDERRSEFET